MVGLSAAAVLLLLVRSSGGPWQHHQTCRGRCCLGSDEVRVNLQALQARFTPSKVGGDTPSISWYATARRCSACCNDTAAITHSAKDMAWAGDDPSLDEVKHCQDAGLAVLCMQARWNADLVVFTCGQQLGQQQVDGVSSTLRRQLYLQPRATAFAHPPKNARKAATPNVGVGRQTSCMREVLQGSARPMQQARASDDVLTVSCERSPRRSHL